MSIIDATTTTTASTNGSVGNSSSATTASSRINLTSTTTAATALAIQHPHHQQQQQHQKKRPMAARTSSPISSNNSSPFVIRPVKRHNSYDNGKTIRPSPSTTGRRNSSSRSTTFVWTAGSWLRHRLVVLCWSRRHCSAFLRTRNQTSTTTTTSRIMTLLLSVLFLCVCMTTTTTTTTIPKMMQPQLRTVASPASLNVHGVIISNDDDHKSATGRRHRRMSTTGATTTSRKGSSSASTTTTTSSLLLQQQFDFQEKTWSAPSCDVPLDPKDVQVTLVTQCSANRLWMLYHHCHRWNTQTSEGHTNTRRLPLPPRISIAVHTNEPAWLVRQRLIQEMHCPAEFPDQLVVQTIPISNSTNVENDDGAEDYPVNTLRNVALRGVTTSHYLYVDVDFWPSETVHDILATSMEAKTKLSSNPKLAIVVPAFQLKPQPCRRRATATSRSSDSNHIPMTTVMTPEGAANTNNGTETTSHVLVPEEEEEEEYNEEEERRKELACRADSIAVMPRTMEDLLLMFSTDTLSSERGLQVDQFDYANNNAGHGSTVYATWIDQPAGSVQTIPCFRSRRYEPYVVARYCQDLPPYQQVFTGYGKNKISMLLHMRRVGYTFAQLGGAYVIHFPHRQSTARRLWGANHTASESPVPGWKSILLQRPLLPPSTSEASTSTTTTTTWERPTNLRGDAAAVEQQQQQQSSSSEHSSVASSSSRPTELSRRAKVDAIFNIFLTWLKDHVPNQSAVPTCMDDVFSIEDDLFAVQE